MKKLIPLILILLIWKNSFSQSNISSVNMLDSVSHMAIKFLQAKQADSIYMLAGAAFKNQISKENFKNISENQIFPINNFKDVIFVKSINGINKYKVSGKPDLQLLTSLDKENKLETFLIQPYSDN